MRIWLIKTGEPWPTDGNHPRLLRTGVMAHLYARAGDEVVWFNATFDHFTKTHRHQSTIMREIEPRLKLLGLHSPGYRRNVSIRRILDHRECAAEFLRQASQLPLPEVIVAAMPTLELAAAAMDFGRRHNIPVVIDVRDLWPDIWRDLAPRPLQPLAGIALGGYYRMLREIVDGSSAICGISEPAVDWALQKGTRARNTFDGMLPLAYEPPELSNDAYAQAETYWDGLGLDARDDRIIFCFFGSLSKRIDIGTVIGAALRVPEGMRDRIRVVMCGQGHWQQALSDAARQSAVLCAPGWVDGAKISRLMARADVGLLPYFNTPDFQMSYPNKVFDYLTGGLPIMTSLNGETGNLIADTGCGWLYPQKEPEVLASQMVRLARNRGEVAMASDRAVQAARPFAAGTVYGAFRERLSAIVRAHVKPAEKVVL